jgi:WD40 repeat protein
MQVRDTADGRLVFECSRITLGYGLTFTPDGTRLAATRSGDTPATEFWTVKGWKAGKPVTSTIGPLNTLAFSPDGKFAAIGGYQGQVALWNFK